MSGGRMTTKMIQQQQQQRLLRLLRLLLLVLLMMMTTTTKTTTMAHKRPSLGFVLPPPPSSSSSSPSAYSYKPFLSSSSSSSTTTTTTITTTNHHHLRLQQQQDVLRLLRLSGMARVVETTTSKSATTTTTSSSTGSTSTSSSTTKTNTKPTLDNKNQPPKQQQQQQQQQQQLVWDDNKNNKKDLTAAATATAGAAAAASTATTDRVVPQQQPQQQQQPPPPPQQQDDDDVDHYETLPFSFMVGNVLAKQALVVAAVDPSLSVLLVGPTGCGKSAMARSLYKLLPPTVSTSTTKGAGGSSSITSSQPPPQQQTLPPPPQQQTLPPPPMITIPLHCQEDALLGTVDLEKSLETGTTCLEQGLLAQANQGMLLVDDFQLLEEELRNILMNALQDGFVRIEREGLSSTYTCRPLFIATMNPAEGGGGSSEESMQACMDRIAMVLPIMSSPLTIPERVQVVQHVEGFLDHTIPVEFHKAVQEDKELRIAIARARTLLPQVVITTEQMLYICQEATRADCEGQRAEIYATKIAKAAAAIQGRTTVQAKDLQLGVLLAIAPRARVNWLPMTDGDDDTTTEQLPEEPPMPPQVIPPPPPPPPPEAQEETMEEETTEDEAQPEEEEEPPEEEQPPEEPNLDELMLPQSFMFGVDSTPLDPRLLLFKQWTRKGKGGKRSRIFNLTRGRFVKAIFPKGMHQGRIAVGATLRAAAPFQKTRRKYAASAAAAAAAASGDKDATQKNKPRLVYIRDDDIRIQRLKRKAGSLIIFVVDASGSMALNRMGAAKGAAMTLLQEAYKSRDKICLIAFHDDKADVVVPPTKSMALTKARLEEMPCGGRSPLAHALVTALRTGLNAIKVKQDVGKVVMVLITDGRPTVPLCESQGEDFDAALMDPDSKNGTPSRTYCRNEVFAIARQLGAVDDLNLLVVDTEDKYVSTGVAQQIARLALGNYYALGSVADLAALTREHVEQS